MSCDNIYIWKSEIEEFTSLANATFKRLIKYDLRGLEGKTVRVIADDVRYIRLRIHTLYLLQQ